MNVIVTFVLVFLSGILGFVTANEERIEPADGIRFAWSFRLFFDANADIKNYEAELCMRNGGPNAYDAHRKSLRQFFNYVFCMSVEEYYEIDAVKYSSQAARMDGYLTNICQRVSNLEKFFKNVLNDLKICLDPEKQESTNIVYNTISLMMNSACEDSAKLIKVLLEDGAPRTCFESNDQDLRNCTEQTIFKYFEAAFPSLDSVSVIGVFHLLAPDANKCTVLEEFRLCTVGVLKTCPTSVAADLTNSTLNLVQNAMTCDRILQDSQSQAMQTHVGYALFMTSVLATSLLFS